MYYLCSENKGADQLRGHREADLRLCFRICKMFFFHDAAHLCFPYGEAQISIFYFRGLVGIILTAVTVLWCSVSASKLFVSALEMDHQQLLVAYPCALVYGVFALLTVF